MFSSRLNRLKKVEKIEGIMEIDDEPEEQSLGISSLDRQKQEVKTLMKRKYV